MRTQVGNSIHFGCEALVLKALYIAGLAIRVAVFVRRLLLLLPPHAKFSCWVALRSFEAVGIAGGLPWKGQSAVPKHEGTEPLYVKRVLDLDEPAFISMPGCCL